MRRIIKRLVNSMLKPLGVEVRATRRQAASTPLADPLLDPFYVQSLLMKNQCATVFDVGANIGIVSAIYKDLFPKSTIHTFEPFAESFQKLRQRYKDDPSIRLNEIALSDEEGTASLNANASSGTNSMLQTNPLGAQFWGKGLLDTLDTISIPTTTIDAYCQKHAIGWIDILKLDIQGTELRALRGAKTMLRNRRIKLVYMEVIHAPTYIDQPQLEDYLHLFREARYILLDLFSPVRKNMRLIQSDVIFVPDPDLVAD